MASNKRVAIRNHSAEANLFARRTFIAFIGILALLLTLISNIYELEINSYEKYQTRSNSNRIKLLPVAPNRGLIYDRNGILLADNKPVYSLEVIAEQTVDLKKHIVEVSELLDISEEKQQKLFEALKSKRRFKPVELHSRLSAQQVALFSVNQHKFPGFFIDARLKRYYPFGDLTTHSLGYVARINLKDSIRLAEENLDEDYAATRNIGKLGLEKYYENILHGTIGHQEVEINNQGRIIRTLDYAPPISGKNLTLSIDIELQMIAKRALAGKRGAVVAIDPRSGEILAMYSNPSYDGNLFVHGISSKNYRKLLNPKNDRPLLNRSVQGYPPASTVKPLLGLTGLEAGVITNESRFYDPGWFQLKGLERKYRDWWAPGHGWVDLNQAIEHSCNVFFYNLAYQLDIDTITDMMEKFGFGDLTGVDIWEDKRAILPGRETKRSRYNKPWYTGDTIAVGIGQGYWTVTPLQLAQAFSILTNKGDIKIPHFLRATAELVAEEVKINEEITTAETEGNVNIINKMVTKMAEYDDKPPIVLKDSKHWSLVLDAMHNTAQKKYPAFKGARYDAAGKSGTAQLIAKKQDEKYDAEATKEKQRNNAMFVAFAPYENPEIVVAVVVENVLEGGGGFNAAPVARQVMDQYFGDRVIISTDKSKHPQHNNVYGVDKNTGRN
ncbi:MULTISPECIES: penicillin-binding protein 2 [unclassified Colwellia]|jgi:penicillin-binding protein 2|uniref:penicillin-binding protein 2 n=1 Tax=unclassified Colwellia TaxID=196834 RepID=UPI0015F74AA4|nr:MULTISPECIES: penicillin-binding protein 2 [unclassified Colwellia]MBA6337795.1 penicillin-binding protein 2 [Colwellia sp. BRX8-7]MBA6348876.1 penicillin-binding protein 2 [Colwellia sp. BRX8-9]MBA6352186.1 penicillin-binding protein 2 [Colwellia sp. BRX9-1]MBA6355584.1 penicillin-binding protein 2 [Colwellia sp. BRX8-3]MBA6360473.1 penicillin-binding protein 2 [Colwellia sp. BRX8-6]